MLAKAGPSFIMTALKSVNCEILLKISLNDVLSYKHNSEKVIVIIFLYKLADDKTNVLCKGLNFSVKPGLIEYSEFLQPLWVIVTQYNTRDFM